MFDFSFTEMLLAGVVALIVLGPERLPKVARFAGEWVGKIQRMASGVKNELSAHAEYAELSKIKQEVEQTAQEICQDLQQASQQVQQESSEIAKKIQDSVPAWERLPEQKTPADFGVDDLGQPLTQSSLHTSSFAMGTVQVKTLRKQAMARKRDMRPRHRPAPKLRSRR
ncbi:Sec-independent protein translocase protein TatB [Kingella kingae]|uniref:Sec-independent protein translocase protein TatB n=1 Tax=Kingella kingae TaxID=504 RepID=UPI00254BCBE1|nr:Sec-independent protein translocase protein TatB [Kingella kingae]MDK4651207.1 Sec-independent protein translocase protein TatB [Kingella kingae]